MVVAQTKSCWLIKAIHVSWVLGVLDHLWKLGALMCSAVSALQFAVTNPWPSCKTFTILTLIEVPVNLGDFAWQITKPSNLIINPNYTSWTNAWEVGTVKNMFSMEHFWDQPSGTNQATQWNMEHNQYNIIPSPSKIDNSIKKKIIICLPVHRALKFSARGNQKLLHTKNKNNRTT